MNEKERIMNEYCFRVCKHFSAYIYQHSQTYDDVFYSSINEDDIVIKAGKVIGVTYKGKLFRLEDIGVEKHISSVKESWGQESYSDTSAVLIKKEDEKNND